MSALASLMVVMSVIVYITPKNCTAEGLKWRHEKRHQPEVMINSSLAAGLAPSLQFTRNWDQTPNVQDNKDSMDLLTRANKNNRSHRFNLSSRVSLFMPI